MIKNMSNTDRVIRVILTVIFSYLYLSGSLGGFLGLVLFILGIVFLFTSITSYCPIYHMIGLRTLKKEEADRK